MMKFIKGFYYFALADTKMNSLSNDYWTLYGIVGVIAFFVFLIDKQLAIHGLFRVPEVVLFVFIASNPLFCLLGMIVPWHKVRKPYFWVGIFLSLLVHAKAYTANVPPLDIVKSFLGIK
ncbi:hypothetical protein WDU94_014894 [Cyamophila willieti]